MAKTKISEYSTTNSDNTDIENINIAEGCAPSGINNAIRELMVHLKEFQTGASGDAFTFAGGTLMSGTNTISGAAIISGNINSSGTNTFSGSNVMSFSGGSSASPSIYFASDTNTGIFSPAADTIAFTEGGAESMRIDASGNMGLGVTPSAWGQGKAFEISAVGEALWGNGLGDIWMLNGAYFNGGFKYSGTTKATAYRQGGGTTDGSHSWHIAASGTAGNTISFTQAMTLDASGRLILGDTTADGRLKVVETAAGAGVTFYNSANNSAGQIGTTNESGTVNGLEINAYRGDGKIVFKTAAIERMRIDSSGNVGIGTSSPIRPLQVGAYGTGNGEIALASSTTGFGSVLFGDGGTGADIYRGYVQYNHTSDAMIFATAAIERARITSGGDFYVGSTGLPTTAGFAVANYSGGTYTRIAHNTSAGSSDGYIQFYYNSTQIGSVAQNGTSAVQYLTSSDYRLKENIAPMTGALATVSALKPCTYTWKADGSVGQGFIAHELQAVVPDAVTGEKDGEEMQGVDYGKITPLLTAALQEAIAEIQSLKARIAVLEAK